MAADEAINITEAEPSEVDDVLAAMDDSDLQALLNTENDGGEEPDDADTNEEAEQPEDEPEPSEPKQEGKPRTREEMLAENARLQEQLRRKDEYIHQRSAEIGALRKGLKQLLAEKLKALEEDPYGRNPLETHEALREVDGLKADLVKLDEAESSMAREHEAAKTVLANINPQDINPEWIAGTLSRDGFPDEYIADFLQNPYKHTSADAIIHLCQRARAEAMLEQIIPAFKAMQQQLAQANNKPRQVVQNIKRAARTQPQLTARSGGSSTVDLGPQGDPSSWSPEELDAYLSKTMKR